MHAVEMWTWLRVLIIAIRFGQQRVPPWKYYQLIYGFKSCAHNTIRTTAKDVSYPSNEWLVVK